MTEPSIARSTDVRAHQGLDANVVHATIQQWNIGSVHEVTAATGGATNWVYRVQAEQGCYFLRVYRKANAEAVAREHALLRHLRRRGVPAPLPQALPNGSATVSEVLGHPCALYEAAAGVQTLGQPLTLEQTEAAGKVLAMIHTAAQSLPDTGYPRWELSWDGAAWAQRLQRVEQAIRALPVQDETDRWALERVQAQQRWLLDGACCHSYSPRFPPQVTHGDYQQNNLFFEGGSVSAVIDWEQAAFMPPAYELVRAAGFLYRLASAGTRAFVNGYLRHHPMSEDELLDGARAWSVFSDHHVWPVEEAYLNGNAAAKQYIPHQPFRPFLAGWRQLFG